MTKHTDQKDDTERDSEPIRDNGRAEDQETPQSSDPTEIEHEHSDTADQNEHENHQSKKQWFKRYWHWIITHKKYSIPAAVLLLLITLAAVPYSRYTLAGLVLKQTFPVVVLDADTGKPVSSAVVKLGEQTAKTNNEGRTEIRTNVGYSELEISKKYYQNSSDDVLVPINKPASAHEIELKATGRAVPVTVLNKISKKPVANVTIKAADEDTEAKTDKDGKATLVVPADKKEVKITLSGEDLNQTQATLKVTSDEDAANTFEITPSGKIYFLSNASGNIDLVKSNLDGTDREVVLAGTGKEDRNNTVLLASRDWKYIALLSQRDGGEYPKLFLIDTSDDSTTVMDEGEATFTLYGWSDDRFTYRVNRDLDHWEAKRYALKSYDASAKKITKLDETAGEGGQTGGYASETIENAYVLGDRVVYNKNWNGFGAFINGKQPTLNSINADGSQKKTIKSYPSDASYYISLNRAEFGEIYIRYNIKEGDGSKAAYDEYKDSKVSAADITDAEYDRAYPTYAVSPSSDKTLFSDSRDGKNTIFVGDGGGNNGREIGRSDEFTVYGWFTDNYVLLTKKGSEMYILAADVSQDSLDSALKVSDYYKPPYYYNRGFGYGYGG